MKEKNATTDWTPVFVERSTRSKIRELSGKKDMPMFKVVKLAIDRLSESEC